MNSPTDTTYDFTRTFETLNRHLDDMTDVAEDMFVQITDRDQIEFGRFCLSKIDELKKLKDLAGKLQERMEDIRDNELCLGGGVSKKAATSDGLRRIAVEITEGMLRQSLLSLTQAKKSNMVKLGEQFTIRLSNGEQFVTDLIDPGNKLRERGRIRAFYMEQDVKPGDSILLREVQKGIWEMEVRKVDDLFKGF